MKVKNTQTIKECTIPQVGVLERRWATLEVLHMGVLGGQMRLDGGAEDKPCRSHPDPGLQTSTPAMGGALFLEMIIPENICLYQKKNSDLLSAGKPTAK